MKKRMVNGVLVAAVLCLSACACTKNSGDGDGYPETTAVKTKYNKSSVIRNPLTGWVMYAARDKEPSYWDTEIYVTDLAKTVKIIDYASACYLRTSWRLLNPEEGVYTWRDPSTQTGRLIQGALDRGLPIAFRIVVDGADQGMNTPQFVFDKGIPYTLRDTKFPDRRTPYPEDPTFQAEYAKLIRELAKDFNDPDKCAFIDAYGLGKWGEAHGVLYNADPATEKDKVETLKYEVLDWITSLYAENFTKVPLVLNYHRVVCDPLSEGSTNPNTDKLLALAISKGYSLRSDAFGMKNYYGDWEKSFARSWNYKRPIIMEGGWIIETHRYWAFGDGYREGHPEDVRKGEFDASSEARVNMMDFRAGNESLTWFKYAYTLVQRFVSEGGYRLYPEQVALPGNVSAGTEVKVTHRWRNTGWGYFPNNIPQWNYKYKVALALLDSGGNAKKVFIDTDSEPSDWHDVPVEYDLKVTVDVPAGKYTWAIAIVDTRKENKPAINLAVNDETTAEGWVKLLDVQVK